MNTYTYHHICSYSAYATHTYYIYLLGVVIARCCAERSHSTELHRGIVDHQAHLSSTRPHTDYSMKLLLSVLTILLTQSLVFAANPPAFITSASSSKQPIELNPLRSAMNDNCDMSCSTAPHPFTMLPGDPSLILHTNVDLGDKKLEIMKGTCDGGFMLERVNVSWQPNSPISLFQGY